MAADNLDKIAQLRTKVQLDVGQLVLAMMNLSRYRHQTLGDLSHILVEPLLRDRIAIAHRNTTASVGTSKANDQIAGIAIYATVSDAVDAKINEQVKVGTFPVRLGPDDWVSGNTVWLLDVIAGDAKLATAVLGNFHQLAGQRPIRIHPVVTRLIDPAALERIRSAAAAQASANSSSA